MFIYCGYRLSSKCSLSTLKLLTPTLYHKFFPMFKHCGYRLSSKCSLSTIKLLTPTLYHKFFPMFKHCGYRLSSKCSLSTLKLLTLILYITNFVYSSKSSSENIRMERYWFSWVFCASKVDESFNRFELMQSWYLLTFTFSYNILKIKFKINIFHEIKK